MIKNSISSFIKDFTAASRTAVYAAWLKNKAIIQYELGNDEAQHRTLEKLRNLNQENLASFDRDYN